jgi:hypothetical protein
VHLLADVDTTPVVTYYSTDGSNPDLTYPAGGFLVSAEGTRTIKYASVADGVSEVATKTQTLRVDSSAPVTTGNADGTAQRQLILSAADEYSGVGAIYYRMDGSAPRLYTGRVKMKGGRHAVSYWSTDAVGNVESPHSGLIVNPAAVALGTPSAPKSVRKGSAFTVLGSISPKQANGTKTTKILAYRLVGTQWVLKKWIGTTAVNSGGRTKYKGTARLTTKGKWKLIAYSPEYGGCWEGWSQARAITVK